MNTCQNLYTTVDYVLDCIERNVCHIYIYIHMYNYIHVYYIHSHVQKDTVEHQDPVKIVVNCCSIFLGITYHNTIYIYIYSTHPSTNNTFWIFLGVYIYIHKVITFLRHLLSPS